MTIGNIISSQAARLKKIRLYLGMTRQNFGAVLGISQYTIRSWENGEKNFNTEGVQRIVCALKEKIKFNCDFNWLMYGSGSSPISLYEEASENKEDLQFDSHHEGILKEVITFKQLNKFASVAVVSDNTFSPIAEIGDYIGLTLLNVSNLDSYIGKIVFLLYKDDTSEFGILDKIQKNFCVLHLTKSAPTKLILSNINKFYQLIWLRKIY